MARLNPSQPSAAVFTIHEEGSENGPTMHKSSSKARLAKYSRSDRSSNSNSNSDNSTRDDVKDKKPRSRARTKSREEESENDGRSLAVRFTSLEIRGSERDSGDDRDAEPTPRPKRKTKSRRPLGSTRANPLLLPLSSSSAKKERYSLTNLENFHPKSENWEDEDDTSNAKPKRSGKESDETKSKPSREAARVGPSENILAIEEGNESGDGFNSLDDFIISDDEDISYHDSEEDIKEDEEKVEEEIILKPKTPRRLFRGRRPAQAKHDKGKQHDGITEPESLATAKELPNTTLSKGKGFVSRFDLKPTSTTPSTQYTPVKKKRDMTMDSDIFQERRAEESPSFTSKTTTNVGRSVTPPTTPLKPRLQSPSKAKNRIPISPYKSTIDDFWNQEAINEWNDAYSPKKTPARRGLARFGIYSDDEDAGAPSQNSPSASPEKSRRASPTKSSPTKASLAASKRELLAKKREFDRTKASIAESFLKELDSLVTGSEIQRLATLTGGVRIDWSKTLNKTAGRANWKREVSRPNNTLQTSHISASFTSDNWNSSSSSTASSTPTEAKVRHHASIELAEKVIDNEHRLLNTLAHEYCHLANFMISNVRDNPHGASFKAWAEKCHVALRSHPVYATKDIKITTKHSYEINYKYLWCCETCACEYGRHSKSIDPKKSRCGQCKGFLVQVRPKPRKQKTPVENKENRDPLSSASSASSSSKKGEKGGGNVIDLTKTLETITLEKSE